MALIDDIIKKIEKTRVLMYRLMNEKEELTDPELVVLSQKLDELLNEYDKLIDQS
jgi:stage 0 sporulation regulatory protein